MKEVIKCRIIYLQNELNNRIKELQDKGDVIFDVDIEVDYLNLECTITLFHHNVQYAYKHKSGRGFTYEIKGSSSNRFGDRFEIEYKHNLDVRGVDVTSNAYEVESSRQAYERYKRDIKARRWWQRIWIPEAPFVQSLDMSVTMFCVFDLGKSRGKNYVATTSESYLRNRDSHDRDSHDEEWIPLAFKHGF